MMKLNKEEIMKRIRENPTINARCYIFRQLGELYGDRFYKEHYLIRDDMIEDYYEEHQEEIDRMFPGNHV